MLLLVRFYIVHPSSTSFTCCDERSNWSLITHRPDPNLKTEVFGFRRRDIYGLIDTVTLVLRSFIGAQYVSGYGIE